MSHILTNLLTATTLTFCLIPQKPHRISGSGSPYPSSSRSSTYSDPFRNPAPVETGSRGTYAPVAPIEMHNYEDRNQDPYVPMEESYANEASSHWLEKEQSDQKRSKWVLWGAVALGAVLIIGGIIAGIAISTSRKHSTSSSGGSNNSGSDPSKFDKNPNLHNSFYGFAYTPLVRSISRGPFSIKPDSLIGCNPTGLRRQH
jgi:hypothetical protein